MRRFVSILVAVVMLVSVIVLPAQARPYQIGDLNDDLKVNSADVNLFKRLMTGSLSSYDSRSADIDEDSKTNGTDLNLLKRHLVGDYPIVQPFYGVDISEYTVIYPAEATVYEQYALEILLDTVSDRFGVELTARPDTAPETDMEIIIGATNRISSYYNEDFEENQYICKLDSNDIVIGGRDYMIGGGVSALCYEYTFNGYVATQEMPTEDVISDYNPTSADSVILMIGDGMGDNQIKWANYARRPIYGGPIPGFEDYSGFIAESFPNKGHALTYSISELNDDGETFTAITTDSSASATALATGWKTQNEKLGMNGYGAEVKNIREYVHDMGLKTGVLATEPLTGATPSGFTVHAPNRYDKEGISAQQQALIDEGKIDYLKGDVYNDLLKETKIALDIISTDSDGFFMMIEESYIDKACHDYEKKEYTDLDIARYVARYNSAIQYAATFAAARPGTILIVTADHETGGLSQGGVITNGGNHSNTNVPVFAMGYGTEIFHGAVTDNIDIAKFMASVYGIEDFGGDFGDKIIHR